jgi:hypothetical protein
MNNYTTELYWTTNELQMNYKWTTNYIELTKPNLTKYYRTITELTTELIIITELLIYLN